MSKRVSRRRYGPKKEKGRWKNFDWGQGEPDQILVAWILLFGDKNFEEALDCLQNNNSIDTRGRYCYGRLTEEKQLAWEVFFGQSFLPPYALTRHHIKPRSRGGRDEEQNILHKTEFIHQAWHNLFINKLLDEIIRYLKNCQRANWQQIKSNPKKLRSWLAVFGNKFSFEKIIAIIKKDWFLNDDLL